ncbi:MAG TPA: hypothetical protein GXZ90_06755 [Clostridiales bacterium]|nr:hypothetical protein [Clostridiales bacterium]
MSKFHINKQGKPAICKANKGKCPFGDQDSHFKTEIEAQTYVDKINEEEFGLLNKVDHNLTEVCDIKMIEYNVYYETDEDTGNIIIEANNNEQAHHKALEMLNYDVNFIQVNEIKK